MPLPKRKILRCRIESMIAIEHGCINAIGVGSLVTAYIVCLLCQHRVHGKMYLWKSSPRNRKPFYCYALDLPFTDKDIPEFRLMVNRASPQSIVCLLIINYSVVVLFSVDRINVLYCMLSNSQIFASPSNSFIVSKSLLLLTF